MGEFNTAKPLLKRLYERYHIVLTYFSFRAKDYLRVQQGKGYFHELYRLPLDLPPLVRSFEKRIRPKAILIMERELWPSLLLFTKAPKVWLNAYSKGGFFERWLSKSFSLIIAKEESFAERFRSYGCKNVLSCGNLKFLLEDPPAVLINLKPAKLIVAGSTHRGEELLVKKVYERLKETFPDLKLIVAPRHISRYPQVMETFKEYQAVLRSRGKEDWDVLVVDTLGELFSLYAYGDIALVGGTFVPVGGHNLLEPAYFGKPVVYGPYTHKVEDLKDLLQRIGLGFEAKGEDDLYEILYRLLSEEASKRVFNLREYAENIFACYLSTIEELLLGK